MKPLQYYKKQIFIMGCLGMFPMLVFAQETLSSANGLHGDYSGSRVERSADGDKLDIEFSIGLVEKLKSQQMMYISPRFVSVDGKKSVELEPVCISGRRRYKVVKRRKTLHNVKSDQLGYGEVHSVKELKETPLTFKSSFPFESWMADGHLVVDEKLYGCAECGMSKNEGIALQAGIPLFGAKDYAYDFIEPEKVLVKCYKDSFDCKVTFPVAQHDLRKTFADNRQELAGLGQFVSENLLIKGAELKDVYIKGYASPEGDFNYNKSLAQRRTQTLSNYISSQYPALKKAPVYRTEGVGEDWEGLKAAVSGSTLSNKDKILFIIEHNSNDTERESAIRELDNDKTYHILLEEFYPALRRTTFSLSFDVRPYTSEELPGVFETKPECLSLYEMYQLAGLYASRGENPLPVYKKAYEQFPGDIVAVLNYANALLKYGKDADGALQVLEVVREDSRVLFPMAIAYDMKGDWKKAEKQYKNLSSQVTGFVDLVPTLKDLVGDHSRPKREYDGISILPVLNGKKACIDRDFYLGHGAVVNKDYKLIRKGMKPGLDLKQDFLVDYKTDPYEKKNASAGNEKIVKALYEVALKYDTITPCIPEVPYGKGRDGFKAPKEWKVVR